jgi:hypothetical protein
MVFVKGSGGNFLARVLTLDPATVPLGGTVDNSSLTTPERLDRYRYNDQFYTKQFNKPSGNNGLSHWVNMELNQYYFPLTMGVEKLIDLNLTVVEPIHPEHFEQKLQYFGVDDQIKFCYIDPLDCHSWIVDQRFHKGVCSANTSRVAAEKQVFDDCKHLQQIVTDEFVPVNLKNILLSGQDFLNEYDKICKHLNILSFPTEALEIYQTWKKTWKTQE